MTERGRFATDMHGLLLGDLTVGARIGDYQVDGRLASRGTGLAYAATHVLLPRRVVIKVMPVSANLGSGMNLLREACIVEALDHSGIPRLYECGVLPDRRPWIATELVEGMTLAAAADTDPMTPLDIATLLRDIAEILVHAHGRGIVHCNLLATTIVVPHSARRFPLCLTDWAGARTHDTELPAPLVPPIARFYTAPELLRGEPIDGRTDIYALGTIARELLEHGLSTTLLDHPPILTSLLGTMCHPDRDHRPTAAKVWAAASWLVNELRASEGVPVEVTHEASRPRTITSELCTHVVGEIAPVADPGRVRYG